MSDLSIQVQQSIKATFGDDIKMDFVDEKGDGKHFYLDIISDKFKGLSRVQRSQLVYQTLDEFMKTGYIHALRMRTKTPNEL